MDADRIEMILEAIQRDFKAFGEGLTFVRDGVSDLQQRMGRLESGFERHELRLGALEQEVRSLRAGQGQLRVGQEELRTEIGALREETREVLQNYERRIAKLESRHP